ncbi:MAG: hypothetical protein AABY22_30180 [Nanoarchaeota archaeon]
MFQKGNKYGRGNSNSGTKTKKEIIEAATETITQEALINLANSRVYKQMIKESGVDEYDYLKTKELALPVTLKGMTEKKEHSGKVQLEQITGMEIIKDESPIQNKN